MRTESRFFVAGLIMIAAGVVLFILFWLALSRADSPIGKSSAVVEVLGFLGIFIAPPLAFAGLITTLAGALGRALQRRERARRAHALRSEPTASYPQNSNTSCK